MAEMVDIIHPPTGDTGRIPVRALKGQRKLGWITTDEHAAREAAKVKPSGPVAAAEAAASKDDAKG